MTITLNLNPDGSVTWAGEAPAPSAPVPAPAPAAPEPAPSPPPQQSETRFWTTDEIDGTIYVRLPWRSTSELPARRLIVPRLGFGNELHIFVGVPDDAPSGYASLRIAEYGGGPVQRTMRLLNADGGEPIDKLWGFNIWTGTTLDVSLIVGLPGGYGLTALRGKTYQFVMRNVDRWGNAQSGDPGQLYAGVFIDFTPTR